MKIVVRPNSQASADPTVYYSTKVFIGTAFEAGPLMVRIGATGEDLNYLSPSGLALPGALNNDDRDQLQYSVGARVGYNVTPDFIPFVQATTDTRDYTQSTDDFGYQRSSTGYRASVGATYKPSSAMSIEAFIGSLHQDFDDARFASLNKPYFGANLDWKPKFGTRFSALIDRALEETTAVGASSYLDTTLALDAEHALTPDLVADARIAFSNNDYEGTSRQDRVTDARAGFKYYFDPVVFFGADVRVINRESDQRVDKLFPQSADAQPGLYTRPQARQHAKAAQRAWQRWAKPRAVHPWKASLRQKLAISILRVIRCT